MAAHSDIWQITVRNNAGGQWPFSMFRQQQDIILVPPGAQAQALTLDDAIAFHEHLGELIAEARATQRTP